MNKATIITGPADAGKTRLTREMIRKYDPQKVVWLSGRNRLHNHPFWLSAVTENTQCIVIDDIMYDDIVHCLADVVEGEFVVERQAQYPLKISHPLEVIINMATGDHPVLAEPAVKKRFNIIQLRPPDD